MNRPLPPFSMPFTLHWRGCGGVYITQEGGSESLFSASLPYKESGSSSAAILNDGHLLPSSTLDSSHCETIAIRCWNLPAFNFHHLSLSCPPGHGMNLFPFVMAA